MISPKKMLQKIFDTIRYLFRFNGLVILAKLPQTESQKTGYYHRVLSIDKILHDIEVIYVDTSQNFSPNTTAYDFALRDGKSPPVLRLNSISATLYSFLLVLRCKKVYFHNITNITSVFRLCLFLPFIKTFLDFHGAAPEEHDMAGLLHLVDRMGKLEKLAITNIDYFIIVADTMRKHLEKKYKGNIHGRFILLPIIQPYKLTTIPAYVPGEQYQVIYAGNAQRWQRIPRMIEAITKTVSMYRYLICCTDPESFNELLPEALLPSIRVESVPHKELLCTYPLCHYGFALRESNVVNHVACPTKLVEYLAYGIVPIIETPYVGDFSSLGMQYVTLENFEQQRLPSEKERLMIVQNNRAVFMKLRQQYLEGSSHLWQLVSGKAPSTKKVA